MRAILAVVPLLLASGCMSTDYSKSIPAVLVDDGTDYRPVIRDVVSKSLNGRRITLTRNVLMTDSRLLLEPKAEALDPFGNPMSGRILGKPDDFSLKTINGTCVLLHENTGEFYPLEGVNCRPL